jgi:hypothetical protein
MGYKPVVNAGTKFTFDDYPGLEIYADAPTMGDLMDIGDIKLNMNDTQEKRIRAFDMFASYIKTWNIDHPTPKKTKDELINERPTGNVVCARCGLAEDMPLPTTAEHMMCLPLKFIMSIFFGWLSTVSRVDPMKYLNLNDGGNNFQGDLMKQLAELQNPTPFFVPNTNLES